LKKLRKKIIERRRFVSIRRLVFHLSCFVSGVISKELQYLNALTPNCNNIASPCTAIEYAKQGIRINAVCPGFIDTEMINRGSTQTPEQLDYLKQLHPMGRIGTSEEVANTVVWLCSDKASFITGHALNIDGGFVAA
jgi:Enoyl-(Acyl carrier protein) reductase